MCISRRIQGPVTQPEDKMRELPEVPSPPKHPNINTVNYQEPYCAVLLLRNLNKITQKSNILGTEFPDYGDLI